MARRRAVDVAADEAEECACQPDRWLRHWASGGSLAEWVGENGGPCVHVAADALGRRGLELSPAEVEQARAVLGDAKPVPMRPRTALTRAWVARAERRDGAA